MSQPSLKLQKLHVLPLGPSTQGAGYVVGSATQSNSLLISNARSKAPIERRDNLVVFGIEESQSLQDTMASVQKVLHFVTGSGISVKDLVRIGKYKKPEVNAEQAPSRPRPLLLKLASAWDRRLVLSNKYKLKQYDVQGIFIREDLTPEERQQRREKLAARTRHPSSS